MDGNHSGNDDYPATDPIAQGARLATVLARRHGSNRKAALAAGCHPGTLANYISGQSSPPLSVLHAICQGDGDDIAWVATGVHPLRRDLSSQILAAMIGAALSGEVHYPDADRFAGLHLALHDYLSGLENPNQGVNDLGNVIRLASTC